MTIRINPFQLPELCQNIGLNLGKQDIAHCCRVSRDWNLNFIPILWHSIGCDCSPHIPDRESHGKYGQYIKDLSLSEYSLENYPDYLLLHSLNLSSLTIGMLDDIPTSVLSMKPRLTKLILKNVTFSSSIEFWGFTSRELMCLRHLELEDVMISSDAINLFWDTCTRLQTIRLQSIDLPEGPEKFLLFPDIAYLSLSRLCNITEQGFHQWVSRCPNLKSLLFRQITRIPSAICSSHVIRENWPMLESLGISGSQLSDYELSQILYGMKTVKDLRALNTGFGPISFGAMKPHLKDLRELSASSHTQDPGPIDSTMMHEIMVSCPELDVLDGVHAIAEDLLAYDAPWIAIRLTSLNLAIGFPLDCDPSVQIAMFKQLSRLKSLETLSLHEAEGYSSLDFRLSRGMGQLKSLTKLREISLGNTIQQMEKEDVQWLVENMGSLSVLKGKLNQDPEKSREFGSLSTSRHTISSY